VLARILPFSREPVRQLTEDTVGCWFFWERRKPARWNANFLWAYFTREQGTENEYEPRDFIPGAGRWLSNDQCRIRERSKKPDNNHPSRVFTL